MTQDSPVLAEPLIVLVPGLGLDDRAWVAVRRRLAYRVCTALLPALGRRAPRGTDLRVERQAERLLNELAVERSDAVVLVGHSASCPVVVEAAARSDVVVGLVLVGPVTDPRARTWPRMLGQWLRTARHEHLNEVPVLAPQYWRAGAMTMVRGLDAMRRYRTDQALARIDLPVVIVRGSKDRIATQDWARRLTTNARGRLEAVDGAAHMVPLTHPEAVAVAVRAVASAASAGRAGRVLAPTINLRGSDVGVQRVEHGQQHRGSPAEDLWLFDKDPRWGYSQSHCRQSRGVRRG